VANQGPALKTAVLIVAGGRGVRAGGPLPKQYVPIRDVPVLVRTLNVFLEHPAVQLVTVAIGRDDLSLYDAAIGAGHVKLTPPVTGGDTRQRSVLHGLRALDPHAPDRVLIHDAVRPFVSIDVIDRVLAALAETPGAVAGLALADTLKRAGPGQRVMATVPRDSLWRAQTPQGFRFADILGAHEAAAAAGQLDLTDDAAVAEWAGLAVTLVQGSEANRKLTTMEDLVLAAEFAGIAGPDVRTGQGFDVHRFAPGDHVWLGGVRIPHTHALEGHSDADVALHALTDALLGAIGAADIGQLFPNTDPRWKGAASHLFLTEAARRVRERGGTIANVDLTILGEAPKVAPHRTAIRQRIADILAIEIERVGVKATTTEGLGFTGRREGMAAMATATVILK
jgi:2-C-methyl-D-erythritol 4-phosphate cytidylyltransferase / 2-C-methyl-D-erythritol 2,4-cyclodiphosphate synthase